MLRPQYIFRAKLMDGEDHPIYDGDSWRIEASLGFGVYLELDMVRFFGINCAEVKGKGKEKGFEARDFCRELMKDHPEFSIATFKSRKEDRGKWGRYLVDVHLDNGINVNKLLVQEGHAVVVEY